MTRNRLVGGFAAVATGAALVLLPGTASAGQTKTCTTSSGPNGQFTTVTTQSTGCPSSAGKIITSETFNGGGNAPPGQQ